MRNGLRTLARNTSLAAAAAACLLVAATPDPEPGAARAVRKFGAATAAERDRAAAELAGMGAAAVPSLERAAADDDPDVRDRARRVLAELRRAERVADGRRAEAAAVLREARAGGTPLDAESDADLRLAALLPESGDVLAAAALRGVAAGLADDDLAAALARHPTPATLDAMATLWEHDVLAPSSALRAGRLLERSLEDATTASAGLRADAARAAAARIAAAPARSAPRRLGRAALLAGLLGGIGDDSARTHVAWALRDPDPAVRREAARAAGRLRLASLAADVTTLAADCDPDVRAAALLALSALPGLPRPDAALAAASDEVPAVRRAAVRLLATDGGPDARPLLAALAEDASLSVRTDARRALRAVAAR